jgi:hypothetical protein
MHNRCWTANRLARRGLPRPDRCPICNQSEQTINHLLLPYACQFWFSILQRVGMQALSPQPHKDFLNEWWSRVEASVNSTARKGINSLIILGVWTIWKHRNRCLFEGASPNLAEAGSRGILFSPCSGA